MLLLLDECTPRTVELVFRERSHEVRYVVDDLAPETPDHVIAAHAHREKATVVTWNYKHFRRLHTRRRASGELAFPDMGLLGFQCPEVEGPMRLRTFIHVVEAEHDYVSAVAGGRLSILIDFNGCRIWRR